MHLRSLSKTTVRQLRTYRSSDVMRHVRSLVPHTRCFHGTSRVLAIKPFLLADIGEGIRECEIIQWFVEPEARVEEFDKLCEVQSDKASVEITSRFTGVIKKLHYEAGDMAKVGKPLVDIDIQGEIKDEDKAVLAKQEQGEASQIQIQPVTQSAPRESSGEAPTPDTSMKAKGKHASLATPAVRHLTKELDVNIEEVSGTGRDGRVLKEDVHKFAKDRDTTSSSSTPYSSTPPPPITGPQVETTTHLTNTQHQMFKTMTKSLQIPHFLYAQEISFHQLTSLRKRLNTALANSPSSELAKLSYLPFIIKAVSLTLDHYPLLNSRVSIDPTSRKPSLVMRCQHNIGIAMDTPSGLLVPVIRHVQSHTIKTLALELSRLQSLASSNKLTSSDLTGGTITISNIGSIGGTYVSPVIVEKEVAILGIGKMKVVPAFDEEDPSKVVRREVCNFSWSADHRVVDGATMARAAEMVRGFVESPDSMVVCLR